MGNKRLLLATATCATLAALMLPQLALADSAQSIKLTNQGNALLQTGDDDAAAMQVLVQAVKADPGNMTARRLLARAELQCGQASACAQQILAIATVQPNVPSDLILLGKAYQTLGKTSAAGDQFQRALQIAPRDVNAMLGYVDVLIAQSQYAKATALCKRVLATTKNSQAITTATEKLSLIEQCSQKLQTNQG